MKKLQALFLGLGLSIVGFIIGSLLALTLFFNGLGSGEEGKALIGFWSALVLPWAGAVLGLLASLIIVIVKKRRLSSQANRKADSYKSKVN